MVPPLISTSLAFSIMETAPVCSATGSGSFTGADVRRCIRTHSFSNTSSSEATEESPSEWATADDSLDMSHI
eukprot:3843813-Prymnesium_polylepis.1